MLVLPLLRFIFVIEIEVLNLTKVFLLNFMSCNTKHAVLFICSSYVKTLQLATRVKAKRRVNSILAWYIVTEFAYIYIKLMKGTCIETWLGHLYEI